MESSSLIDAAISGDRPWKQIGDELSTLPSDSGGAQRLKNAYRDGSCEPWMTAFLLGCVGDATGYETAREILLSRAGGLSGSYASVAMAKMQGVAAYPDLLAILIGDHTRRVRHDAVYGLASLNPPRLLDDLYDAYCTGKLSRNMASWHIGHCEPPDDWIVVVLESGELDKQKLGCAVVDTMVRGNTPMAGPGRSVAALIKLLLSDGDLTMMPSRRKRFLEWIEA